MTDWLEELDRLERESPSWGSSDGLEHRLLYDHARELIDATKEQNTYEEELREDRDAYATAHKRAQHTVNNLLALLRRMEWIPNELNYHNCHFCWNQLEAHKGHTSNCELAAIFKQESEDHD